MSNKRHIPALTLTEVVNQYMLQSFNDKRKYYLNYLVTAKWAWKDLLWNTVWQVKSKYVEVDKSTMPYSIPVPADMIRFLNVSEVDSCGNLQPYAIDDYMNVLEKPKSKTKCNCHKNCGCEDALCDAIDSISVRLKEHLIDGNVYTEKVWNKRCDNGDLLEIREVPVKDYSSELNYEVKIDVQEKLICSFEVNECGCIKPTQSNLKLLVTNCGCYLTSCMAGNCDTDLHKTPNDYGRIKIENNRIYIDGNTDWVILSYQTNGECGGEEILVPEIAVDALMFGIDYRAKAFKPNVQRYEKEMSRKEYNRAKMDLQMFLNPIRIDEFMRISWQFPVWGSKTNSAPKAGSCEQRVAENNKQEGNKGLVKDIADMLDKKLENVGGGNQYNITQPDEWDTNNW